MPGQGSLSGQDRLLYVEQRLADFDRQIQRLMDEREEWLQERELLLRQGDIPPSPIVLSGSVSPTASLTITTNATCAQYFADGGFAWSSTIHHLAKETWGISSFRTLQQPIINAALDGRDVFVIMPTGSGKSLCYQLPALVTPGVTVVISPLIALIQDQVFGLRDVHVPVGMLTSQTPKEEVKTVQDALRALAKRKTPPSTGDFADNKTPRMVYVTPEKVAKSKRFMALLEALYTSGRLARIVIDECHCCSQFGHDFRPDYKKLGILKRMFPKTPLMALTATCPMTVLNSVVSILEAEPICTSIAVDTSGEWSEQHLLPPTAKPGTLLFNAPLHRPNLCYQVLEKAAGQADQVVQITNWIQHHHSGHCGIIYCLSRREAETLAQKIYECSSGAINVGVYHADLDDRYKAQSHHAWRTGNIKVMVATIAFGMGINNPQVRFVLHHSLSKSLEGYYQESGRAGRDGLPADCVLFYRAADASRLSTWAVTDCDGLANAYEMVRYAEDVQTCRKALFEAYFTQRKPSHFSQAVAGSALRAMDEPSQSSFQSQAGHSTASLTDALRGSAPCGTCDHCQQNAHGAAPCRMVDVTAFVKSICLIVDQLRTQREEKLTFLKLVDAWCKKTTRHLLLKQLVETGKACLAPLHMLSKADCERLINQSILSGYLKEDFHFTAYSTIAYLVVNSKGHALLRRIPGLSSLEPAKIEMPFLAPSLSPGPSSSSVANGENSGCSTKTTSQPSQPKRRKTPSSG